MENDDGESGGYGKPPRNTRFKKGVSGNPSGRPKGQATLPAILRRKLDKKVAVTRDGRREKITMREAIVEGIIKDAATGSSPSRLAAVRWIQSVDKQPENRSEYDLSKITDEELDELERILVKASVGLVE